MPNLLKAISRMARVLNKPLASIFDQLLFSGSNFIINIIFARMMSVSEYGIFALNYSIVVLWFFVLSALHLEPIAIFRHRAENKAGWFISYACFAAMLMNLISALLFVGGLSIASYVGVVVSFEGVMLFLLSFVTTMYWTFRQLSYADNHPWLAVMQTIIYSVGLFVAAYLLSGGGSFDASRGLLAMSIGAGAAVVIGIALYWSKVGKLTLRLFFGNLLDSVSYGVWALPSNIVAWLSANIFLITLPMSGNAAGGAILKTLVNILLPFQQVMSGLSLLVMPSLAKVHSSNDLVQFRRISDRFMIIGMCGGSLMSLIMLAFGDALYESIYGQKYAGYSGVILWGLGLPLLMAPISVIRTATRAANSPSSQFKAYFIGAVVVGVVAVPVGTYYGELGAVVGMTVMQGVTCAVMVKSYFWDKALRGGGRR